MSGNRQATASLLRGFDGTADGASEQTEASSRLVCQPDIRPVLEAVAQTAASLKMMASRLEQLEDHSSTLEAQCESLQIEYQSLARQSHAIASQRDALQSQVQAQTERARQLESFVAEHVARANSLERELAATCDDLTKIAASVRTAFGFRTEVGHAAAMA